MSFLRPLGITTVLCYTVGLRRKCDATFTAYVTVQVLKELKCAVFCYLQGRVFNPTNLLNHVAPSIEPVSYTHLTLPTKRIV